MNIARQNGFILTGKHGTGKSTLLHLLIDKEDYENKNKILAFNEKPQIYYLKLKNESVVSIIETPEFIYTDLSSYNQNDSDIFI